MPPKARSSKMSGQKHRLAKKMRKSMTPSETALWKELKNRKMMEFRFIAQHPAFGYILDFYCHELSLVIEVDGSAHDKTVKYDMHRNCALAAKGFHTLRLTDTEVLEQMPETIKKIRKKIRNIVRVMARYELT